MTDPIHDGLKWLAQEISATRQEFRNGIGPKGDELLDGLLSHGYVRTDGANHQVSDAGWGRLGASP